MNKTSELKITTPSDREVVLTRVFDAPRPLVFDALTKPELLKRWYGPSNWSLEVCEIDFRVGGKWHFVSRRPDGKAIGQLGEYLEIVPVEKIVNTESWEDWDAGETVVTTILMDHSQQKTTFTSTILFPSKEVRDTVLKSGLEHGAAEIYDRLNEVLSSSLR